jgi:hypothetical protein
MSKTKSQSSYLFIDKDPIIDLIRTEAQRGGDLRQQHLDRISYNSGVSTTTLRNWFFGETRRPQRLSSRFVLDAIGIKVRYYRADGSRIRTGAGL